jgi:hypothetical protein
MPEKAARSKALRDLASRFLHGIPEQLLTSPHADLATALVRQWITDDRAAIFVGDDLLHLRADFSGPEPTLEVVRSNQREWLRDLMLDFHVEEDAVSQAIIDLNVSQSSTIENRRGEFLRLSVNAKNEKLRIERLNRSQQTSELPPRGLDAIARDQIDRLFSERLDAIRREELAQAVLSQWETTGFAAVFLDDDPDRAHQEGGRRRKHCCEWSLHQRSRWPARRRCSEGQPPRPVARLKHSPPGGDRRSSSASDSR